MKRLLSLSILPACIVAFSLGCGDKSRPFDEGPNVKPKAIKEFSKNDKQHGNIANEDNEPLNLGGATGGKK
jgi:hypothetical protein